MKPFCIREKQIFSYINCFSFHKSVVACVLCGLEVLLAFTEPATTDHLVEASEKKRLTH